MKWPGQDRWLRLWQVIGASGNSIPWHEQLAEAYEEPYRRYHNQRHLAECLAEFDGARHLARQAGAVELALWFHDAVYDARAHDNEERSAELAERCLAAAGLPDLAKTVGKLVMITKTHDVQMGSDAALVVDVDLGILGQNESRYAEYETQIREEYRFVPEAMFNAKRTEILQSFLARKQIYATDYFVAKYELRARSNLENSIRRLKHLWK